jgi:hypothetical protein
MKMIAKRRGHNLWSEANIRSPAEFISGFDIGRNPDESKGVGISEEGIENVGRRTEDVKN